MRFDLFHRVARSCFDIRVGVSLCACVCLAACSNPTAEAERAKAKRAPTLPASNDPLDQQVAQLAATHAGGMLVHDNAFRVQLEAGAQHDFLVVLLGGHCYKAIGVAEIGVNDLDLALFDPAGSPVQHDITRDPTAVLGQDEPMCLSDPGAYRLHVRARDGAGTVLVRFFKTEQ
jgi:hypothetical protein